jgi:hypothetical protein
MVWEEVSDDEKLTKNRWYKGHVDAKEVEPCPLIKDTHDELDCWCKPWKACLVVCVLVRHVIYRILENNIRRFG